ncbi:hypothetical protein AAEY27_09825 [Kosakonia sp. BYX6]|uniref:Uncharacterized protein n=1 Tax=Kosakonia calanthes TaxID=3139408 RepID=A0ABZ3BG22_9ENTR
MYDSTSNVFDVINSNGNTIANCTVKLNNSVGTVNNTAIVSGNSSLTINGVSVLPKVVSVGGADVTDTSGATVAGFTATGYLKSGAINSTSALGTYKGKSPVYAADGATVLGWTPYYNS